jgi:serine/threonine protein kinase
LTTSAHEFEILEILGEGSFGTVCVAKMSEGPLRRTVALKILKGAYATNRKVLHRTRDEARLLAQLDHPNIVRVEQLMEIEGRPVAVMELVRGVSLDRLVTKFRAGIPVAIAVEVTRQTALALHAAHADARGQDGRPLKVIHRDIKPSNILLSIHGEVKVVDFGIAKGDFSGREADTESVVLGSRPYMAPERLDGAPDTPGVDVYSLGMTLFELLSGRTMNLSINPAAHDQAMAAELGRLDVLGLDLAGQEALRDLVRLMCAYDRELRPSAQVCAERLGRVADKIDPAHRISLDHFARTVVVPVYESRTRRMPDSTEFSGTDARRILGGDRNTPPISTTWRGRAVVALLVVLVAVVGTLAGLAVRSRAGDVADGEARVKLWFPKDAVARVGDVTLTAPGHVHVPEGPAELHLEFRDGTRLACTFPAGAATAVRYVFEEGKGAISVNDGEALPCRVEGAPPSP